MPLLKSVLRSIGAGYLLSVLCAATAIAELPENEVGGEASSSVILRNGFTDHPDCPIAASDWQTNPHRDFESLVFKEGKSFYSMSTKMILSWYYSGPEAIIDSDDFTARVFSGCFDGEYDCGLKSNKKLAKILRKRSSERKDGEEKYIRQYFSASPPASAIAATSSRFGRCFGDNPAQPPMEALNLVRVQISREQCYDLKNYPNAGAFAWQNFFIPSEQCKDTMWVPDQIYAAQTQAKKAETVFASRPIEERIDGLNGCQIAYGLVFGGLNGRKTDPLPDEAITWALQYEQAAIDNQACPIMPEALSNWVQKQPLDTFEPAQDPFLFYLQSNMTQEKSFEEWRTFIARAMGHYETAADVQSSIPDEACDDFSVWLNQSHYEKITETRPERMFLYQLGGKLPRDKRQALCVAVPQSVFRDYGYERQASAQLLARMNAQDVARKKFFDDLEASAAPNKWKQTYRPAPRAPRCYRTGETQETCFYN